MSDLFEKRYRLQNAAIEILGRSRLNTCNRIRIKKTKNVAIRQCGDKYSFGNLAQCGLVWACPVCSAKITERRREELSQALVTWTAGGGKLLFVTFTVRHLRHYSCRLVLDGLLNAYSHFWRTRIMRQLSEGFGIVGRVRSLETTYGINGWHAHIHTLCFLQNDISAEGSDKLEDTLKELWIDSLEKVSATASKEHGLKLELADEDLAEYLAKFGFDKRWGMSHELTKPNSKSTPGLTPFELLERYCDFSNHTEGYRYAELFREYLTAFAGKSQLRWTRGMRNLLKLEREKTDLQLVTEPEKETISVGEIAFEAWRIILGNDMRGECLNALQGGIGPLERMLLGMGITAYNSRDHTYPVFDSLPF